MSNAFVGLAKLFKDRENKEKIGPFIAKVVEPMPNLKLKALDGHIELNYDEIGDNIFISRTLTNRIDIDVTFKEFESKNNKFEKGTSTSNEYKSLSANGGSVVHPAPVVDNMGHSGVLPPNISSINLPSGNVTEIKTSNHKNEKENKEKGKLKAQFLITLKKDERLLIIPNEEEDQFFIVDVFEPIKEVSDKWEYYQKS